MASIVIVGRFEPVLLNRSRSISPDLRCSITLRLSNGNTNTRFLYFVFFFSSSSSYSSCRPRRRRRTRSPSVAPRSTRTTSGVRSTKYMTAARRTGDSTNPRRLARARPRRSLARRAGSSSATRTRSRPPRARSRRTASIPRARSRAVRGASPSLSAPIQINQSLSAQQRAGNCRQDSPRASNSSLSRSDGGRTGSSRRAGDAMRAGATFPGCASRGVV